MISAHLSTVRSGTPRVSIGLPVYNGAATIAFALDALLGQSYRDFELVISDNASTDATARICEDYALRDPRVRYLRQPSNVGAWRNFGHVVTQAQGEFFMWAAHDDWWSVNWLETLVQALTQGGAMAYGDILGVDERGQVIGRLGDFSLGGSARALKYFLLNPWDGKANLIYGLYRTAAVRSHVFDSASARRFGFDMHFVFHMLQYGEFVHAPGAEFRKLVPLPDAAPGGDALLTRLFSTDFVSYLAGYLPVAAGARCKALLLLLLPFKAVKLLAGRLCPALRRRLRKPIPEKAAPP